jgi:predicted dehydrogenase
MNRVGGDDTETAKEPGMIGVGVVGYGYWGPNLVRNFAEAAETQVVGVTDTRPQRLAVAQNRYPGVQVSTDFKILLANPKIDAIAICTPVCTHFELAMQALKAGKHVLVEKPLATSSAEVLALIEEAQQRRLVLMVDHTFVYTGAVRKIAELVHRGAIGDLLYYDSVRINLGLFQHDVDVIWDLAVHDFSIMQHILPAWPRAIAATGIKHVASSMENIAYITAFFDSNLIAHVNVNWLSPVKVRRTLIGGSKQMIVYDDVEGSEKVKVYDTGITVNGDQEDVYKMLVSYRSGDMYAPKVDPTEALKLEVRHFAECILQGALPTTSGLAALQVVQALEAATMSMRDRGRLIELPSTAGVQKTAACMDQGAGPNPDGLAALQAATMSMREQGRPIEAASAIEVRKGGEGS